MGPIDEAFVTASLKTWVPNNWQFLERLNLSILRMCVCWARGTESHTYLNLFPRKFLSSLDRNSYSEVRHTFIQLFKIASLWNPKISPTLLNISLRRFHRHSEKQVSEDFTDTLNTSLITGPHTKLLHSNWNSHRFLYPCCTSHVEFLSLLGSASTRVPTPLNSDVTSSLPVARVAPITNVLHFSLVSSAMWNAARGPNYPSIISESGHQAVSLTYLVNYARMRFCAGRL